MLETLINAFKVKDIRRKVGMMLLLLFVFRLGCYIPVPGLDIGAFSGMFDTTGTNATTFLDMMNAVTGGALSQGTLFALGIGPYINASIIMQLLAVGIPALERLSKQGEEGQKKIAQITRYLTIVLALIQSVGIVMSFANQNDAINVQFFLGQKWLAYIVMSIIFTAGALIVMWLGERITDYGVGNGQSMIIFVGILSTAGILIRSKVVNIFKEGQWTNVFELISFAIVCTLLFFAIIYVDLSERKVPVQYAKQIKGRKMYGGQSSSIPIRISGGGVMPLIFAFSILSFPQMIAQLFSWEWLENFVAKWLSPSKTAGIWNPAEINFTPGTIIYPILLCLLIFVFAFFYAQMQFNPEDVSKSIQQNGGFIQGIRPGKATENYLKKISNRITLFGAIYLALVALLPPLLFVWVSPDLLNAFSTTGLLIVVSCAMEFEKQLQAQLMMKNYKGFLK